MFSIISPETLPIFNPFDYRPASPSPLSSSPIRASPFGSPPLSPRDPNILPPRNSQSSPISASCAKPPKFKYASRAARPTPPAQKRETAQEGRRALFLKNVRQRAEDKRWESRRPDQQLQHIDYTAERRDWQNARVADVQGVISESEIYEFLQQQMEEEQFGFSASSFDGQQQTARLEDIPDELMMLDALEQQEEAEFEKLFAMASEAPSQSPDPMSSVQTAHAHPAQLSDGEDYDAIFMDFLANEGHGDVEMS